jgi:hypothetical protein
MAIIGSGGGCTTGGLKIYPGAQMQRNPRWAHKQVNGVASRTFCPGHKSIFSDDNNLFPVHPSCEQGRLEGDSDAGGLLDPVGSSLISSVLILMPALLQR